MTMPGPTFLDVFQLETHYPIFSLICTLLPIQSIVALTRTCKAFSGLYQSLLPIQWNVDRYLSRFVQQPELFRSQMGKYDALVSGSVALQFFERVLWRESDLDIFIQKGESAELFARYLIEKEGYTLRETNPGNVYIMKNIFETRTFTRWSESTSTELKTQIIFTECIPVQAILRGFYSTVVVNFFSWNKAYAIFSLPTFVHHKGYLLKPLDDCISTLLVKYSKRGWAFQDVLWPEEANHNHPFQESRRVGDRFTWTIPLSTYNVEWSTTPDTVLEYAQFGVHYSPGATHSLVSANKFVACTLKYTYTFGYSPSWMDFLGERMDRLSLIEFHKLDPAKRPQGYGNRGLFRELGQFEIPEGWTYWDHEIPNWYRVWEQTKAKK